MSDELSDELSDHEERFAFIDNMSIILSRDDESDLDESPKNRKRCIMHYEDEIPNPKRPRKLVVSESESEHDQAINNIGDSENPDNNIHKPSEILRENAFNAVSTSISDVIGCGGGSRSLWQDVLSWEL
jgi:hypothetical protein